MSVAGRVRAGRPGDERGGARGGLPDYVYANDDPLDVSDPTGLDGTPAQSPCTRQSYTNDPAQHANCNVAFATYSQDEANHDFAANLVGLCPNQSIPERALGFTTLLPVVGWAGRGIGLAVDAARGVMAVADVADAVSLAEDGGLAGAGGDWPSIGERPDPYVVQQAASTACVSACGEMLLRSRGITTVSQSERHRPGLPRPRGHAGV